MATRKGSVSKDTQALVQGAASVCRLTWTLQAYSAMMKQSNLTPFQQRQLKAKLQSGGPLPKSVHPTSSRKKPSATSSQVTLF